MVGLQGGLISKLVLEITPVEVPDQVRLVVAPDEAGGFNVPLKLVPNIDVHSANAPVTRKMADFLIASSK